MIIDFHTHIFPPKIAGRAVSLLGEEALLNPFTDGTSQGLLGAMEQAGVQRAVTLPVATNPDSVESINRFAIGQLEEARFLPFGAMHPDYPHCRRELERLKAAGIRGVKLHPEYQDCDVDDPRMVRVLACAGELGLVAMVHGGVDDAYLDRHRCTPRRIAGILPAIGCCRLVVAHYGGNRYLHDVPRYLGDTGVYIDTSFTHSHGFQRECAQLLREYNPGRILFGTDSPWGDAREDVAFIKGLDLGSALEERIFHTNARELLGLGQP